LVIGLEHDCGAAQWAVNPRADAEWTLTKEREVGLVGTAISREKVVSIPAGGNVACEECLRTRLKSLRKPLIAGPGSSSGGATETLSLVRSGTSPSIAFQATDGTLKIYRSDTTIQSTGVGMSSGTGPGIG
jgi:hypothetical protein